MVLQGYAYILTHPGIPTVFYDHFYDWGDSFHGEIAKLVFCSYQFSSKTLIKPSMSLFALSSDYVVLRWRLGNARTYTVGQLSKFWRQAQICTLQ
jgi:hypothetical protein